MAPDQPELNFNLKETPHGSKCSENCPICSALSPANHTPATRFSFEITTSRDSLIYGDDSNLRDMVPMTQKDLFFTEIQPGKIIRLKHTNIPVRCLYVSISRFMQNSLNLRADLLEHFEKNVGPVENIEMCTAEAKSIETHGPLSGKRVRGVSQTKIYALVTLQKYEDVHRAMNSAGWARSVPAYHWHQPKYYEPPSSVYDKTQPSLDDLTDDCLLHVFRYLTIVDVVNLRTTSPRYETLAEIFAKTNFTVVDLTRIFHGYPKTLKATLDTIEYAGPVIKKLRIDDIFYTQQENDFMILKYIKRYCRNLEELDAEGFQLGDRRIATTVVDIMKRLTKLVLRRTNCTETTYRYYFRHVEKLRSLIIISSYSFDWLALHELDNLQVLRVDESCYTNERDAILAEVLIKWKTTLKVLHINQLTCDPVIEVIAKHLTALEELSIDTRLENLTLVGKCKSLRKLTIQTPFASALIPLLEVLVKRNQLQELNLCNSSLLFARTDADNREKILTELSRFTSLKRLVIAFDAKVTDSDIYYLRSLTQIEYLSVLEARMASTDAFLDIIKQCVNLKYLNICGSCVGNDFVWNALELLKRTNRPRLELAVHGTEVTASLKVGHSLKGYKDKLVIVS